MGGCPPCWAPTIAGDRAPHPGGGDEWAALVYQAQAHSRSPSGVGIMLGCFTELIDAVILTGGLANSKKLTGMVIDSPPQPGEGGEVIPGERDGGPGPRRTRILDGREQGPHLSPRLRFGDLVMIKGPYLIDRYGPFSSLSDFRGSEGNSHPLW